MNTESRFETYRRAGRRGALLLALVPLAAMAQPIGGAPVPRGRQAPPPSSPGAASPPVNRLPGPPTVEPPTTTPFFDQCKTRGCHPQITGHSPAKFGLGINVTLTGQDFGPVKGKVRMTTAGVTVELPVQTWAPNQVVAGYQGVIGVIGGPSQVSVGTTDGSWSNPENVVFNADTIPISVPAEVVRVDSCAKGTHDNQCNGVHVGEGDLQAFDYKNPPAAIGHHYDKCSVYCFGGGSGVDTYSVGPLKFGFRIDSFKVNSVHCGKRSDNGHWDEFTKNDCSVEIKKVNIEDDRGTFQIIWKNPPTAYSEYAVTIRVKGPAGMIPW